MKTYLYPLLAGLLSLAACTNDTLQEIAPVAPGENTPTANTGKGTFFVDYSVDGGASTRAGGSPLKVQTLDYYVYYAEGGELVKHRRIRIDSNQSFPLTRDNMTWEQRQALQDTLQYDVKYRTLFIANVDSTLFNYGTYSNTNPHPAVVTGDTLYQNARILLPNVPFHEDNYYCLWEDTLHQLSTAPLNGPMKRHDVLLQRIVTRTDIRRVDTPTTLSTLTQNIYNTYAENATTIVSDQINKFCSILKSESEKGITQADNRLKPYGESGDVDRLINYLKDNLSKIQEAVKNQIISRYTTAISNAYKLRTTNWAEMQYAQCNYANSSQVNSFGFDLTPYTVDNEESTYTATITNGTFSIISFAGITTQMNTINSIDFSSSSKTFTITGEALVYTSQEKNRLYEVTCDPANSINIVTTSTSKNERFNLDTLFTGDTTWDNLYNLQLDGAWSSFQDAIGRRVFRDHEEEGFGESLENFSFPITIPDIQSDADFRFIPSWNMTIAE